MSITTEEDTMVSRLCPDPKEQFEAARSLRHARWSFFRISQALGITLSQVRVACDPKAQEAHDVWCRKRVLGESHQCTGCARALPAYDFPEHHSGTQGWKDAEGIHRQSECRTCKRARDRDRTRLRGRTAADRAAYRAFSGDIPEDTQPARVPVGPFSEWLKRKWAVYQVQEDGGQRGFAATLGMSVREVDRYRLAEYPTVRWNIVDKVLVTEGSTSLWELYPNLYPRDEAA